MAARAWPALLVLLLALAPAAAGPGPQAAKQLDGYAPPAWPAAPPGGALLGRLALLTVLALAVSVAILWWARRLPRASPGPAGAVPLRVVDAVSLGGGCSLHLLQLEQARYVVGVDGSGLKAIHLLSEPFEQLLDEPAVPPPAEGAKAA